MNQSNRLSALAGACAILLVPAALLAQPAVEEVLVTATPVNQSPDELAQSVSVLAGDELNRVRAANLGETLAGELGISASYFGAGSSRPIIRGLAGPRVRMMEDGIDALDVSTISADHAVSIDPLAAEQIEIFRGPTTLLYGSGAVGGVINTVTNRIPEFAPDDGFEGVVELRGDTVSGDSALSFALDGGGSRLAWHLDALARDSDDYEIPVESAAQPVQPGHKPGELENSDLEVNTLATGLSWLGDAGFFGISLSGFGTNYGLPGHHEHEVDGEPEEQAVRIDLEQSRVDLKGGWLNPGASIQAVNLRVGLADYEHVELEGGEAGTRFDNAAYEARVEVMPSPWGEWNGAFGLQVTNRDFSVIGDEAYVPPTETTSVGLFVIEQRELTRWQFSLGARVESQRHVPTGGAPQVSDSAASFSVAAIRDLGAGYALSFNTAVAERMPVADELYANGPHLATATVEIGDPGLGSETSRHFDLGIRRTEGELTWAITAFITDYDDYIYLRDTGAVLDNFPVHVYSSGAADFAGIEAELFMPVAEPGVGHVDLRLFADYVQGELDTGESLPRLPPRRSGARLQYHRDDLLTGLEVTRYSDQDRVAAFEQPTAGYTMLNADLRWTLRGRRTAEYELFARATNLLDEVARRHTSFLKDRAPLPGRNYSVGIRTRF